MSARKTKAQLEARIKELEALNLSLTKVMNMVDAGEWVVMQESTRQRMINTINSLIEAGNGLDDYAKRLDGTTNGVMHCRQKWHDVKAAERL